MHRHYSYYWRRCRECGRPAESHSDFCEECNRDDEGDAEIAAQIENDEREAQALDSVPRDFPCTCTRRYAPWGSAEPPEPILDRYCPQHGDGGPDPDAALEAQRERAVQERLERILEAREARHEREHGPRHTGAPQDDPDFAGWADDH